jgi:hypothetical protein
MYIQLDLPDMLWPEIIQYFPTSALIRLSRVNREWQLYCKKHCSSRIRNIVKVNSSSLLKMHTNIRSMSLFTTQVYRISDRNYVNSVQIISNASLYSTPLILERHDINGYHSPRFNYLRCYDYLATLQSPTPSTQPQPHIKEAIALPPPLNKMPTIQSSTDQPTASFVEWCLIEPIAGK